MDAPETIAAEYLRRGAVIDIGRTVSRGWALVRDNMGVLIAATVLSWIITIGVAWVPVLGWAVGIVLVGGLDYMFIRRIRGEDVQGVVFAGRPVPVRPEVADDQELGGLERRAFRDCHLVPEP